LSVKQRQISQLPIRCYVMCNSPEGLAYALKLSV